MGIAYNTSVVRDGLVLQLDAANAKSYPGTGTVWTDLSGNGNNGRLVNGVGYNSDNNGSMVFDGVDDVCFVDSLINYNFFSNLTVIASHYNIGGDYRGLVGSGYATGGSFEMRYGRENFFAGQPNDGTRLQCAIVSQTNIASAINIHAERDVWGIYAMTYNGTVFAVYKNGVIFNSLNTAITLKTSAYPIAIGAAVTLTPGTDSTREPLPGNVPFIQIYNRALTAQEIAQNFEATRGRYNI